MKLDFLIPGSPNDGFYSQIAMFRLALDRLGGDYERARLVAVFGDHSITAMPERWLPHFRRIEVVRVDPLVFQTSGMRAQCDLRFELIRDDADIAIMCDADTILCAPFADDFINAVSAGALTGVIAHYHFPWAHGTGNPLADWQLLSRLVIGREIEACYTYSLTDSAIPVAPFYVNLGVLAAQPRTLHRLDAAMRRIRSDVMAHLDNAFDAQVALALAVIADGLTTASVPMRYNFPNDPIADERYPEELENIVILHYLRHHTFDRQTVFSTEDKFRRFLDMALTGSNRKLQDVVRMITGNVYPFPQT